MKLNLEGMTIGEALTKLRERVATIDHILPLLISLDGPGPFGSLSASRRGRKSMGAAERVVVSERMTRYWAGRRERQATAKITGEIA